MCGRDRGGLEHDLYNFVYYIKSTGGLIQILQSDWLRYSLSIT